MCIRKKILFPFFVFFGLFFFNGLAQENGDVQSLYQTELDKMVKVPVSPEAQAFMKYGDTKVSLYSGIPQVNIPLHTFEGREFNLPMGLTYDASGIKVEQLATWVGLGWNLSLGGRVTRVVNGLADEYIQGNYASTTTSRTTSSTTTSSTTTSSTEVIDNIINYKNNSSTFSSVQEVENYFKFLYDINSNFIDAEPDYFNVNAPGLSATFVRDIEDNNTLKALNNPRIDIEEKLDGWVITNEDGTIYEFRGESETTLKHGNDEVPNGAIFNEYESSWLLTRITSPNSKDVYVFNYTDFGYWTQEQLGSSANRVVNNFQNGIFVYPEITPQYGSGAGYWIKQQFLTSVVHNGITLMSTNFGVRHDIDDLGNNSRLSRIDLYDIEGGDLKTIEFDNVNYFNLTDGEDPTPINRFDIRLKLNGIVIKGKQQGVYQTYSFDYHRPDDLPSRDSFAQDYFGYYNGKGNNQSLIPKYVTGNYTFHGADREPNSVYAKIGMLTKIIYPTQGYTEFEYGSHDVYKTETSESTVTYLSMSLTGSSTTDHNLYYNDSGQLCDDQYLDYDLPKILFKSFTIPETGNYDLQFTGISANTEGYIMYLGPNDSYINYCDVYSDIGGAFWHSSENNNGFRNFDAGNYRAMIVLDENNFPGDYGSVSLRVTGQVTNINAGNYDVGGLRIEKIRDYSDSGELAQTKFYSYRDDYDKSTGDINFQPVFSTIKTFNTSSNSITQLIRTATFPKGDAPYVVYPTVREYLLDKEGNSEGYTVHTFHKAASGSVPRMTTPFENNYYGSLKASQPIQSITVDANGDTVSKQDTEYFETSTGHVSMNGWVTYTDEGNSDKVIAVKKHTPQGSPVYYTYEHLLNYDCDGSQVGWCPIPGYLDDPQAYGYEKLILKEYSALKGRFSFISGAYGGVSAVVDTLYTKDSNGNPLDMVTKQETTYDAQVDYLPRKVRTTDSKGEVFETTYYYPKDNIVTGSSNLIAENKLTEVVRSETIKNPDGPTSTMMQVKEKEYSTSTYALPTMVKTKKGNGNLQDRVAFNYHTNGNLKEANQINGPTTTYVWGYANRYPVAVVNNATQQEIDGLNLNSFIINSLVTTDVAMRTELNKIRTGLGEAMVTTYTYDPLVGVTSITDPRGYSTYYEYDEFGRLMNIKDDKVNMVQEYEYGYRSEEASYPEDPSLYPALGGSITGLTTVNYNTTHTYTVSPSGGSGNYYFTWYVDNLVVAEDINSVDVTFSLGSNTWVRVEILDTATGSRYSAKELVTVTDVLNISPIAMLPEEDHFLVGNSISFTAPTVSGGSPNKTYHWYVNGTQVLATSTPQNLDYNQFTEAIPYNIVFEVVDNDLGINNSVSKTINAHNPLANFNLTGKQHVLMGKTNTYSAVNVSGGSGNRTYGWEIVGGASLGSGTTAPFTPASLGGHTIRLTISDNDIPGQQVAAEYTVTAYEPLTKPNVSASRVDVLAGKTVSFTTSGIGGGTPNVNKTYKWYNGSTGTNEVVGENGTTYSDSFNFGSDDIIFEVYDTLLELSIQSDPVSIQVHNPFTVGTVAPSTSATTEGNSVTFTASGITGGSGDSDGQWHINGVAETDQTGWTMNKTFGTAGTYDVSFRLTDNRILNDQGGDYFVEPDTQVVVRENLVLSNLVVPSTVTVNSTANFDVNIQSGSGSYSYTWKVQKGSNIHNASTKSFSLPMGFDFYGSVYVECKVTDNLTGQEQTLTTNMTVNGAVALTGQQNISQVFNDNDIEYHFRLNITNLNGSGDYSYQWTNDGQSSGTATTATVYLTCENQQDRVICIITDNVTGQQKTTDITYNFTKDCSGSGGGNQ